MKRILTIMLWALLAAGRIGAAESETKTNQSENTLPTAELVAGKPRLDMGAYDLGALGYQVEEYFVSGTAASHKLTGEPAADGKWNATRSETAAYTTRIVVARPIDAASFSGTAVVEWLNVTGGFDMPVEWNMVHREMVRRGHAYIGVTAQKAGIDGNPMAPPVGPGALKKADAARYGRLSHPGDAYSFDIFSQAGQLVKQAGMSKILGPLAPKCLIAAGESQSAIYLATYANAVDRIAQVYDAILIHSCFGVPAPIDGNVMGAITGQPVKLRGDLRVPTLVAITETDLLGFGPLKGYHLARTADTEKLRVWEIAGTAHADNYVFSAGFIDSGLLPIEKLAAAFAPMTEFMGRKVDQPMNFGPQHHYVLEAALWQLERWVKTGEAAPKGAELKLTEDQTPKLLTDANGLAEGGIRTPWVDVPAAALSGAGGMAGFGKPFDGGTLKRLYPGGEQEYLQKFEASLNQAIERGFIVPEDKAEIMGIAAINFPGKEEPKE